MFQPEPLAMREQYDVLTGAISSRVLEYLACGIGAAVIASVVWNKRWPRVATAFLSGVLWLSFAHGLWMGERSAPAAAVYITMGLQSLTMMMLLACPRRAP